jgi:cobalamin biosynthesis Mg chelatase CobN
MLALLAWCCLPVFAQASSSAGYEYQDAVATPTGKPPTQSNLHGGSQPTNGIGSEAKGGGNGSGKGSGGQNGSSAKPGGSNATGNGQGSQGNGQEGSVGAGKNAAGTPEPGSDSGGSSPLVPILIAIVLLAGGSIAYVMIKRRRAAAGDAPDSGAPSDSTDSSVTPEAG